MMGLFGKTQTGPQDRGRIIAVLDVGSAKTACLIARLAPVAGTGGIDVAVLGWGVTGSPGIKAGEVVRPELAARAVSAAIRKAEAMAGVSVTQIGVQIGCGRLRSEIFAIRHPLNGAVPDKTAQDAVWHQARESLRAGELPGESRTQDTQTAALRGLHLVDLFWRVDGSDLHAAPPQTAGQQLEAVFHAVVADAGPVDGLMDSISQCGVTPHILAAAPFASASAVLHPQEAQAQAVVIDIGAGTTSLAVFSGGNLVHVDSLAIGGNHVTQDIARHLNLSLEDGEHVKLSLAGHQPGAVEDSGLAALFAAIRPGLHELFQALDQRLVRAGLPSMTGGQVVLTGGGSRLAPLVDLAREALPDTRFVLREPVRFRGFSEFSCGASFAGIHGLVQLRRSQLQARLQAAAPLPAAAKDQSGRTGPGLGRWLRENF